MYAIFHKEEEWTTHKNGICAGVSAKEVESEFPYPFQILTEEDSFYSALKMDAGTAVLV